MIKHRENTYVRIINEPAKSRIENNQCPSCGKPKSEWTRRQDWRCCSVDCTQKFEDFCIIRSWAELRERCFQRDKYICVKCGKTSDRLIADHIIPIATGGKQWDINNLQTLCEYCHKVKTKQDIKHIAIVRKISNRAIYERKHGVQTKLSIL